MKGPLLGLLLAAAVAGCGQQKPAKTEAAIEPAATVPAEPSKATATKTISFTCQGDMPVTAIYGTDLDGNPDLSLIISGDQFDLKPTEAPDGTRYAAARGAEAGKGIIWWEKADGNVLLQQAPSDQVDDPDAGVTARTCKVKNEPDPVPVQRR